MTKDITLYRASILDFPHVTASPASDFRFHKDGLLVTRNGKIEAIGDYKDIIKQYPSESIVDFSGKLLVPGLIDSHLHFPQTEMIASYGEQLLEWLQNYTFPTESKFADKEYAAEIAKQFLHQLVCNGTTTALVYSTVHKEATDTLFAAADKLDMCLVAGKVCMDRNCPAELQDTPESAQRDSEALIKRWHKHNRLFYAITPRFAPTSTPEQLAALGTLAAEYPDVFIQTHLSENKHEISWVKQLYPDFKHYLDVYDHYGLVRHRSVFGHCLHLEQSEWQCLAEKGATVAFCPSSNLFLGSGLFDLDAAKRHKVNLSLASDVGAGTSFNMIRTMGEAYKVCQLKHNQLAPLEGLYMMTQGSAHSLRLDHTVGNLNPGTEADFVVLDPNFNPLSRLRASDAVSERAVEQPDDLLFMLSMLGDDRSIFATYIAGNVVYQRNKENI